MTTRIIIARHGNTFSKGQTPTRVGGRTDLPLVEEERGRNIGKYLKKQNIIPDIVLSAPLLRTTQTAELATKELGLETPIIKAKEFVEIDYGVDENKTEDEVMLRLGKTVLGDDKTKEELLEKGQEIIKLWNDKAIVPNGWKVEPKKIIQNWLDFAKKTITEYKNKNILLVTSNGIARFAPHITGDFELFSKNNNLKISTGAICIFENNGDNSFFDCTEWNTKPKDVL